MLCISATYAVTRCLSVCPSVTFVHSGETKKTCLQFFFTVGSHTILVFPVQPSRKYSDGKPFEGALNLGAVGKKIAILSQYLASSRAVNAATDWCHRTVASCHIYHW